MIATEENVRLCFDFVLLAWSLVAYIDDLASFSFFKIVLLLLNEIKVVLIVLYYIIVYV